MSRLYQLAEKWETDLRYGTREDRIDRAARWMPYYSYLFRQAEQHSFDIHADPTGFVSFMTDNKVLQKTDTLLDIGAGTGDYSLRLASACRFVTALEMNPEGIRILEERRKTAGIGNVNTVRSLWEQYVPSHPFDVTFVSMCPAICNMEELLKMESMTKRTCCILTVLPGSYDRHRKAMMQELRLHPEGMMTDGNRYYEILTAMGRPVKTIIREVVSHRELDTETVLSQFKTYFSVFGIPEKDAEDYLKGYMDRNAKNGVLQDESRMRYVLLTWNVN